MSFVQVSETNDSDQEVVDLPLEKDGTLLLSTLHAQYPDACGLKYVAPDNGRTRALRLADDKLHPPTDDGWGDIVYFCSFNKDNGQKRKLNEEFESDVERASKEPKSEATSTAWKNRDLLVLGLPWKTTDEDLESYFSKYGELRMARICNRKIRRNLGRMGKWSQIVVAATILALGLLSASAAARPCKTFFVTSYSFSFENPNDLSASSSSSTGFVTFVTEISQLSLKPSDPEPSNVFSSLRERSRDILSVVVALLFGVGCGALTAATLYMVWTLFSTRSDYDQAFLEEGESDGELSPKKIGYVNSPTVNVKETP